MKVTRIEFENLFLFRTRQVLLLEDQGLVLVRGEIRVSQTSSSNGAGKTSVASMASIAWFGTSLPTPRVPNGLRGEVLANRFNDDPGWVRIHCEDEQGVWSVYRQVRPKKLVLEGFDDVRGDEDDKVLQEKIEARLGYSVRLFRSAIVFGQTTLDRFAQADQADQMRVLDDIHNVDLSSAREKAKAWSTSLEGQLAATTQGLQGAQAQLEQLEVHLEDLRAAKAHFSQEKAVRVTELETKRQELLSALSANTKATQRLDAQGKTLQTARRFVDAHALAKAALAECARSVADSLREAQRAEGAAAERREEIRALLAEDRCPMCRQAVKAVAKRVQGLFSEELARLDQKAEMARVEAAGRERKYKALDAAERKAKEKIPESINPDQLGALEAKTVSDAWALDQERIRLGKDRDAAEKDIEKEQERRWSGQQAIEDAEVDLAKLQSNAAMAEALAKRLERSLGVARYWIDAFGDRGIRSLLLDSSAGFLNERLAYHLGHLAAGEAATEVSPTRALKKGGERDRITITSSWSWGGAGLGAGSNGQDRREDLALFAALQDLGEMRSGRRFPFKIYDEPFDALDARGKEAAAAWLRQEARERGTVLVITHSEEMEALIDADARWTVVLDASGARVETSPGS